MEQRLSLITLGVADIDRARRFYCDGLGWRASRASKGDVVFIDAGGVVLALYPRTLLAEDAQIGAAGSGFGGVALAHNARSRRDVDAAINRAVAAGAALLKPAQDTSWGGYAGYFADPDGHPWEVAYNPHWPLDAAGRIALPG